MARVREVAALTVEDLQREIAGAGRLHIQCSKTDQEGEGAISYLVPELPFCRMAAATLERLVFDSGRGWRPVGGEILHTAVRNLARRSGGTSTRRQSFGSISWSPILTRARGLIMRGQGGR